MIEPAQRHLGTPCIVHAEEKHGGNTLQRSCPNVGQGLETLQGVLLGPDGQPFGDGGGLRQIVVALEHERLDGLEAEDAVELGVQVFGNMVQLHSLLRCHGFVSRAWDSPFAWPTL